MLRIVIAFMLLFLIAGGTSGYADEGPKDESFLLGHPGADLWHNIRGNDAANRGISQVQGVGSNTLINAAGDRWARFRVDVITRISGFVLVGVLLLLVGYYAFRGKTRVEGGCSGQMLHRFSDFQRVLHWLLAIVFIYLAVTGLILLFGRDLLIPLLGKELFSLLASASKESHNLFGPIFTLSIILMIVEFGKKNLYEKGDIDWLLKGGIAGQSHVAVGYFNLGEKIWYWILIIAGLIISVSGLVLVLQNFGQGRVVMELGHIVHVISAVFLIAVSLGHIYMGSVGTEATLEGMDSGYVDLNWARTHHSRWAKECCDDDLVISAKEYASLQGRRAPESQSTSGAGEVQT